MNLPEALLFAVRYLGSYRAYFYFALFTAILIIQLFLPPSVGNADNADSVRLIGGAGLVPNYPPQDRYFNYFTPDYVRTKPNPAARGPLWFTGSVTFHISELLGRVKSGDHFDIRWLGFVHMIVFLIDFGLLLFVLRAAPALIKWCVPALSIWIFGDVVYVAYLNSLYLDAMGLLCLLALVLASVALFTPGSNLGAAVLFACAAIAFAASKPLNAPVATLFGLGVAAYTVWNRQIATRRPALVAAGVAALAGLFFIAITPAYYGYPGLVDAVMLRIAKLPDAQNQLSHFGLIASDLRFAGQNTFTPKGPVSDVGFQMRFAHTTAFTLARWYIAHPIETIRFLRQDLVESAPVLRPLGEIEKQYSASGNRARHFCSWSDVRSTILREWPAAIPLLYVVAPLAAGFLLFYKPYRNDSGLGLILILTALAGLFYFASGSLLDAIETRRHLFMFHAATDVMLLELSALVIAGINRRSERPRQALEAC